MTTVMRVERYESKVSTARSTCIAKSLDWRMGINDSATTSTAIGSTISEPISA